MEIDKDENYFTRTQILEVSNILVEIEKMNKKLDKICEKFKNTICKCEPPDQDLIPYYDNLISISNTIKSLSLKLATYNINMKNELNEKV